ncbi:MAG: hypothetical protein K1X51_06350 [Rhodospirillaceae bacterium]|nr:hypothetical protein [Rhodospirillaceae bacterium]
MTLWKSISPKALAIAMALSGASLVQTGLLQAAWAQAVPDTGIGPAPTGVVPGGVVPVPAPAATPTPDLIPPNPIAPPVIPAPSATVPGQRLGTSTGVTIGGFTEQQVRSNLMAQGYSSISGLTRDGSGVWHGTALRNGANTTVTVDSNGMVSPR